MTVFIDAADFGFRANSDQAGTTGDDDTSALHDAIAAAMAAGGGTVVLPMGNTATNRYSKITGTIWSGDLPYPLTITSTGGPGTRYTDQGLTLLFTGTGFMFDINTPVGSGSTRGHYVFENLGFRCLNNDASAIGLNRLATMTGPSAGDRAVIQNVSIRSCGFYGPENYGSATPTSSPGIFAKGTFHLEIDFQCEIRGWARGVHLHACDDNRIGGRYFFNGRHIMVEVDQTAGNNNRLEPMYMGTTRSYGEDRAAIWNTGNSTIVRNLNFEPDEAGQVGVYENGDGGYYDRPTSNGIAPLFHIGPDARELVVTTPEAGRYDGSTADWIIDGPADPDYGFDLGRARVTVHAPNYMASIAIPPNGRIRIIDHPVQQTGVPLDYRESVATDGKARRKAIRIRADNWTGQTAGLAAPPGQCPILTTDAAAGQDAQGRPLAVIQLPASASGVTFAGEMTAHVGTEFAPGDLIRVTAVSRATANITSGSAEIALYASPTSQVSATLQSSSASSTSYISTQMTYTVPATLGTLIQINIRETELNAPVNILEILIEVVSPAITPVSSSPTNMDLATAVNGLIAAVQRGVPAA